MQNLLELIAKAIGCIAVFALLIYLILVMVDLYQHLTGSKPSPYRFTDDELRQIEKDDDDSNLGIFMN